MKKSLKIIRVVIIILIILWGVIFLIDYTRCTNFKKPIFVISGKNVNDRGSGTYYGLGYEVEIENNLSSKCGLELTKVEMYMFNNFITGAISETNKPEEVLEENIIIIKNGNINNENLINNFIKKTEDMSNKEIVILRIKEYLSNENYVESELKFTPGSNTNKDTLDTKTDVIPDTYEEGLEKFGYYSLTINNDYDNTRTFNKWYWKPVKLTENEVVKFGFEPNKFISVTEFPVICSYNLESSNYRKEFNLHYYQRKDKGVYTIIDKNENSNYEYNVLTFGGDVAITKDTDMVWEFDEALKQGIITTDEILRQCKIDEEYGLCTFDSFSDGGSVEYRYPDYTILKLNTLDGKKDFVVGFRGQIINEYNKTFYKINY